MDKDYERGVEMNGKVVKVNLRSFLKYLNGSVWLGLCPKELKGDLVNCGKLGLPPIFRLFQNILSFLANLRIPKPFLTAHRLWRAKPTARSNFKAPVAALEKSGLLMKIVKYPKFEVDSPTQSLKLPGNLPSWPDTPSLVWVLGTCFGDFFFH